MTWRARELTYPDGPHVDGSWCVENVDEDGRVSWITLQVRGEGAARLMALAPEMAQERDSLARDVARLDRTVGWLLFGLTVPMVLLGLMVGLTLFW